MTIPLKWNNIGSRTNAALINAITEAGQASGDAFVDFGKTITDFTDKKTKDETAALIARIRDEENAAVRDVMIKAATDKSDFLDLDLISQTDYELGQPARDLEKELAAEARAMEQGKTLAEFEAELEMDMFSQQESVKHRNYLDAQEKQNILLGARAMTLQDDQQAHLIEINNANNKRLVEIARIEAEKEGAKLDAKALKGIEKLLDQLTYGGKLTIDEVGIKAADLQHFGLFKSAVLKDGQITEEEFDEYVGNNVMFNDNWGLIPGNPNDFSFKFRGKTYNIGKLFQTDFKGANNDIDAMKAAIIASKQDENTRVQAWRQYSEAITEAGGTPNHSEFTLDFGRYIDAIGKSNNPLQPLDVENFMLYFLKNELEGDPLQSNDESVLIFQQLLDDFNNSRQ